MKEKKNTTTFLGCVVLTDRVTLYVRLLDYYYNTTHKKINTAISNTIITKSIIILISYRF